MNSSGTPNTINRKERDPMTTEITISDAQKNKTTDKKMDTSEEIEIDKEKIKSKKKELPKSKKTSLSKNKKEKKESIKDKSISILSKIKNITSKKTK